MNKCINALTIAGTDPSSGAGIQADLKTFSALGVYGCSVITALVAQNTIGVQSIYNINADFIVTQLESIFNDIRIDTTKIGMLSKSDTVEAVAEQLKRYDVHGVVLDTVILSKSGDRLLSSSAITVLKNKLLPQAEIITPNLPEAAMLLETSYAKNEREIIEQGKALLSFGCNAVLIKGGHLKNDKSSDWLFTAEKVQCFTIRRIQTKNVHGTGCTLSAALAALRPYCTCWEDTVYKAKSWLSKALVHSDRLEVGKGIGPIHHFYAWW